MPAIADPINLLFGSLVSLLTISAIAPGAEWTQFGALGLCGLMVLQNYRDRKELSERLAANQEKLMTLHVSTIEVMRRCLDKQKGN